MLTRCALSAALATGTAALLLTGCSPSSNSASDAGTTTTVQVPTGFDPCKDIPESLMDSEGQTGKQQDDFQADAGKILWRGCVWADPNGYSTSIRTTNLTIDMTRNRHFPNAQLFTINGRPSISTRQQAEDPSEDCTVNTEMKGGSLQLDITNPPYAPKTGRTDTCQLARALAEKVVPTMPDTA